MTNQCRRFCENKRASLGKFNVALKRSHFWDWLVWINQLMRSHSSYDQNMLMYFTAIFYEYETKTYDITPVDVLHTNFRLTPGAFCKKGVSWTFWWFLGWISAKLALI